MKEFMDLYLYLYYFSFLILIYEFYSLSVRLMEKHAMTAMYNNIEYYRVIQNNIRCVNIQIY